MKVLSWLRSHLVQEGPADLSDLDRADRRHRSARLASSLTPAEQRAIVARGAVLADGDDRARAMVSELYAQAEAVRFVLAGCPFDPETDDLYATPDGGLVHVHPLGGAK